jgi:hypothetical protein
MIKGKFDMPKLERSLKRYAKDFGDTTAQAVIRWSIQTCRELALQTQAFGGKGTRKKQMNSIEKGIRACVIVVDSLSKAKNRPGWYSNNLGQFQYWRDDQVLKSVDDVSRWVEDHRTGKHARVPRIPKQERKVCSAKIAKKTLNKRAESAGKAKGGWIGAGNDIARAQQGSGKMGVGVGFLKYAQKHSHYGSSTAPQSGWSPKSKLTNSIPYTASRHVMSGKAFDEAHKYGLSKTITWYKKTLKALDKKP